MKRALLSVTDKTGIVDLAKTLVENGFEILSTGGTSKALKEAGIAVTDVANVTDFPEMLDGRVKTLHPKIHGGLLGDTRLESHVSQMEEAGIAPIQVLVCNLYRFEDTVSKPHTLEEAIESIDIGGPAMIRAASKNHANVLVITDPNDYSQVSSILAGGDIEKARQTFAAKAFQHTAYYDSMIGRYLGEIAGLEQFPDTLTIGFRRKQGFRYGENPHQSGALYIDPLVRDGLVNYEQLWGKELSYNNITDANAAWELVCDLDENACAIIKHANPCGAATKSTMAESYRAARESDPISAFGGIAAFNGVLNLDAAQAMTEKGNFLEVVIAEDYAPEAVEIFKTRSGWGQDVRLLKAPKASSSKFLTIKGVRGGAVVQESDEDPKNTWNTVTSKAPTGDEKHALELAWKIIPHVKSNAILLCTKDQLIGVGAGQMNRVQSVRLAIQQAGEKAKGSVLASDAFFPFPDSIETASEAGVAAIVQPGGSKKDQDVIDAANEKGIAMVFTGTRHFAH